MIPPLTVVLPVRNGERTLAEAMESCLRQAFDQFALHVVLNGCEDGSREIAERIACADPRVRVMTSSLEGGVSEAMGRGVEEARSEFIARMDADDVSLPGRFGRQLAYFREHPNLGVVSSRVRLLEAMGAGMERYVEWVNGLSSPAAVARERFVECPVIQPSLMMRRAVIARAGGYRECGWAEDHDLFLRMLEGGVEFGKVEEVLLEWRDGPARLTRSHPAYGEEQVWAMKAHYLARLPEIRERGVVLCGAGPIGKRLARLLQGAGVTVHGFFEVNPRRVGALIAGVPVAGPEEFGTRWREAVLLSAVGLAGGRAKVRDLAESAGYEEGRDFFATC